MPEVQFNRQNVEARVEQLQEEYSDYVDSGDLDFVEQTLELVLGDAFEEFIGLCNENKWADAMKSIELIQAEVAIALRTMRQNNPHKTC